MITNGEDEIEFELVRDDYFRETMEDPLFMDFYIIVGKEKSVFSVNITFFSMFSTRMRDVLRKIRNENSLTESVEFPQISPNDFKVLHELLTRGRITITREKILGTLKMATFFDIGVLLRFLVDYVERNEEYIDRLDLFLFSYESRSRYLYNIALGRIKDMGELPFLSEKLTMYFSEEALVKLISTLPLPRNP